MNFLAHFQLAWPDPGLVAGALDGEYRKGLLRGELSSDLEAGIRLHRRIDAYTDHHPLICELRRQFPSHLRRYAGILIDLSFDYFLTHHWQRYSELTLSSFNRSTYQLLQAREAELSPGANRMLTRLLDYDILNCYHRWDAVTGSAAQIGTRLRRGNPLEDIAEDLEALHQTLELTFLDFYPELTAFSAEQRQQLNQV